MRDGMVLTGGLLLICWIGTGLFQVHGISIGDPPPCLSWTPWLDRDDPSGTGDFELLSSLLKENRPICEHPQGIRCRTKADHINATETGQKLTCDSATGLVCRNADQAEAKSSQKDCVDYEVRFLCPCRKRRLRKTVIDTRIRPSGHVSLKMTSEMPVASTWSIKAEKGERIRVEITGASSRARYSVYDGKNSKALWLQSKYRFSSLRRSVIYSQGDSLFITFSVAKRDVRYGIELRFWYSVIRRPQSWKHCDFQDRKCDWNGERSNWVGVKCPNGTLSGMQDYHGTVSITVSGKTCQAWDSQYPHQHPFRTDQYPELKAANNYCRNPGGILPSPWCYTTDSETPREFCPVGPRMCQNQEKGKNHLILVKKPSKVANCQPLQKMESCGDILISPLFEAIVAKCLKFDYVLKPNISSALRVEVLDIAGKLLASSRLEGSGTRDWQSAIFKIPDNVEFYVKIEAVGLPSGWTTGDVALASLSRTSCTDNLVCSFGNESTCSLRFKEVGGTWNCPSGRPSPPVVTPAAPSTDLKWEHRGCWTKSGGFVFPSLERHVDLLPSYPHQYLDKKRCAVAAYSLGFSAFLVRSDIANCYSVANLSQVYSTYHPQGKTCYRASSDVFNLYEITSGRAARPSLPQKDIKEEPVCSFMQRKKVKTTNRPVASVLLMAKRPEVDKCILFSYKTSFKDSTVTVTDYGRQGQRTRVAWKMDPKHQASRSKPDKSIPWRTAIVPLRDNNLAALQLFAQKVRFNPFRDVTKKAGFFQFQYIKTVFPCGKVKNCSFEKSEDGMCGWATKPSLSFRWHVGNGGLSFTNTWQNEKELSFIQSPPLRSDGYKCFAFHYHIPSGTLSRYGWGYNVQLIVNGQVHSQQSLKPAEKRWKMDLFKIPNIFDDKSVQIRFQLCQRCNIYFNRFVFSKQQCTTDVDECASNSTNKCSHICMNTFSGYECSCPYQYELSSDNYTCIPICSLPCKNGGKCIAPNKCACLDRYTNIDCSVYCGIPVLRNESGKIDFHSQSNKYYQNVACSWQIQAPAGRQIALEVTKFNSGVYWCGGFKVTVSSQSNESSDQAVMCRNQPVPSILSKSNQLFVSYYLNGARSSQVDLFSFQAKYHRRGDECVSNCRAAMWWQRCCHGFIIASPNVLRQGSTAAIHIATHGLNELLRFKAHLLLNGNISLTSTSLKSLGGGYGFFEFEIPNDFLPGKYQLAVDGVASDEHSSTLKGMVEIGVASRGPTILVQTDKPVYKPGQLVRMRIIAMDFMMRPHSGNVSVETADGKGTKVLQWLDLKTENGVFNLSFSLSSQPVAGTWKVFVFAQYSWTSEPVIIQEACFTVKEYVLPRFQVDVLLPEYIVKDDSTLSGAVSARYTYGKPVKGKVCLRFTSLRYRTFNNPSKVECFQIDGLVDFSVNAFDFVGKWFSGYYARYPHHYAPHSVEINATVTEQGTGAVVNDSKTILVASDPYYIKFVPGTPSHYKPGLPFMATMSILTPDLLPLLNATLVVVDIHGDGGLRSSMTVECVNGSAEFVVFQDSNLYIRSMMIRGYFYVNERRIESKHSLKPRESVKNDEFLSLTSAVPILEPEEDSVINVFTSKPVSADLHLLAIGRGRIHRAWKVKMHSDPSHVYSGVFHFEITLNATCALAPSFFLVAYYIADQNVGIADSVKLQVTRCFEHKVNVSFSTNTSQPGEVVQLSIKADPHSHVSLTAVDKSVYLVPSLCTSNQVSAERVLFEMDKYDTGYSPPSPNSGGLGGLISDDEDDYYGSGSGFSPGQNFWWKSWWSAVKSPYFFKNPGISVITNLQFEKDDEIRYVRQVGSADGDPAEEGGDGSAPVGRVRSFFPEAWLWEDYKTDANGEVVVNVTVPDTITSWIADAFAMSSSVGFGIPIAPAQLVAFKPFFVFLSLPYSVIRGEEVAILATVFNYFYENLTVTVVLNKETEGFDFIGNSTRISLSVRAQDSKTVRFPIIPKKLGRIPLKLTAYSTVESDAVLRFLLVEPEGKEESYFRSFLINGKKTEKLPLNLPKKIVSGSERATICISGDFMGPAISSLGSLLRLPYGCGEQNMVNFAPAVMIKRYLASVGLLTPAIDEKATFYMQTGYQRELTYKRDDYSYAVWGKHSHSGSACLTTYVLRIYAQASSMIYVDGSDMRQSACWVMQLQQPDGSFREPGNCAHLSCGREEFDVTLTAYSLITLVEVNSVAPISCGYSRPLAEVIAKTTSFLKSKSPALTSNYVIAITAYSLAIAKEHATADALLAKLENTARVENSKKHWVCASRYCRSSHCSGGPGTIEATAYAMLAYIERGHLAAAIPVRNWLLSKMDSHGGWKSTQDTVLALMALSLMSIKTGIITAPSLTLRINTSIGEEISVAVNEDNRLITQCSDIPIPGIVHVKSHGKGGVLVQATVTYNIPEIAPEASFEINTTIINKEVPTREPPTSTSPPPTTRPPLSPITESSPTPSPSVSVSTIDDNNLELKTCIRWARESDSGMSIVEVGSLSGFNVIEGDLRSLVDHNDISLQRFEVEARKLILYFNEIEAGKLICFNASFTRSHCVANLQPALIQAYPYYEPDYLTTVSYNPPATLSNSLDDCQSPREKNDIEQVSGQEEESSLSPSVETASDQDEALFDAM